MSGGLRRGATRALAAACVAALGVSGCAPMTDASRAGVGSQAEIYQVYTDRMIAAGRFRAERTPRDAPFTEADLLRNFELVAFEPEAALARFSPNRPGPRRVSKWTQPVRYSILGDGVRRSDVAAFEELAGRLSDLTGLDVATGAGAEVNFQVFIVTPEVRAALGDRATASSTFAGAVARAWIETAALPCFAVFETDRAGGGRIVDAAIFIKAELEEPLRTACLVEETAQSLGLLYDHDVVRPSIFNDDQEFIALTRHDEALIMVLYDPRIRAGMGRDEAVAVAEEIIAERGAAFGAE